MKAIIPVAGHGTRLEPHTLKRQKCLLPVAGKPVLEHILDRLIQSGITNITLIIGHFGNQVKEFCTQYNNAIHFEFIEQKEMLGLGHAIYMGLSEMDEPVLIVLGDAIIEMNYQALISLKHHSLGVFEVPDPERFGIVEHIDGKITKLVEKPTQPKSNLAIAGVYYITSQKVLKNAISYLIENKISTKGEYQLTDALQLMLEQGQIFSISTIERCLDCGIPETFLSTNEHLLNRNGSNFVANTAIINASQLNNSTIMENCKVENCTLTNVIMLENSQVSNVDLKDQIIGFDQII